MTSPPSISSTASANSWPREIRPLRTIPAAMWISGAAYFVHFLALGFASFPLQTHLRQLLSPSSASLVASVTPIAAVLTYFLFRFAESRLWTRSPHRLLAIVAVLVATLQFVLGWQLNRIDSRSWLLGPALDAAMGLLLLGCAHSSCMTLLNHIGVATMKDYAYTVRAAGSAGYMLAVVLMGSFWSDSDFVSKNHLFIACGISLVHVAVASLGAWYLTRRTANEIGHSAEKASVGTVGQGQGSERAKEPSSRMAWWVLLALVWLVAMCEMSYGLYSHEFLTKTYGSSGYFLFAGAIAIEIALLLGMPRLPSLRDRLLFVGPLGWLSLLIGCLLAISGLMPMGFLAMAMALNCPFQISANSHAHKMNESILGVASMTLAQSLGYMTATMLSAWVSVGSAGPRNLWICMVPVASLALCLSIWKLRATRQQLTASSGC